MEGQLEVVAQRDALPFANAKGAGSAQVAREGKDNLETEFAPVITAQCPGIGTVVGD